MSFCVSLDAYHQASVLCLSVHVSVLSTVYLHPSSVEVFTVSFQFIGFVFHSFHTLM